MQRRISPLCFSSGLVVTKPSVGKAPLALYGLKEAQAAQERSQSGGATYRSSVSLL